MEEFQRLYPDYLLVELMSSSSPAIPQVYMLCGGSNKKYSSGNISSE
jgi:hypothetical protein